MSAFNRDVACDEDEIEEVVKCFDDDARALRLWYHADPDDQPFDGHQASVFEGAR